MARPNRYSPDVRERSVRMVLEHQGEHASQWAATFLEADREQPVRFEIWSDDGVEVWLNGTRIHSHDVERGMNEGPDLVQATLSRGGNRLLIKVTNTILGRGFRVGLETRPVVRESHDGGFSASPGAR